MRRKRPISVNSPPQPKKKSPVPDTLAPAPWRGAPWRFHCTSVLNEPRKSFLAGLGAHQAPLPAPPATSEHPSQVQAPHTERKPPTPSKPLPPQLTPPPVTLAAPNAMMCSRALPSCVSAAQPGPAASCTQGKYQIIELSPLRPQPVRSWQNANRQPQLRGFFFLVVCVQEHGVITWRHLRT